MLSSEPQNHWTTEPLHPQLTHSHWAYQDPARSWQRGLKAARSCPNTERNRPWASLSEKYSSRTPLYNSVNWSCPLGAELKSCLIHPFLLWVSLGLRMYPQATAAHWNNPSALFASASPYLSRSCEESLFLRKVRMSGCHDSDVGTDYFSFSLSFPPLFPFHLLPLYQLWTSLCLLMNDDSYCTILTHPKAVRWLMDLFHDSLYLCMCVTGCASSTISIL